MNVFDQYTRNVLSELNTQNVEYLVVGGYAVNYYGYRRTTGDIDIWIKPENGVNKQKIIDSLRKLDVDSATLLQLEELNFTQPVIFIDGEEPYRIDFMTFVSGVEFEEAWKQKTVSVLEELSIPFINLKHLILSKISTGRTKDKMDIEELQKIQNLKK